MMIGATWFAASMLCPFAAIASGDAKPASASDGVYSLTLIPQMATSSTVAVEKIGLDIHIDHADVGRGARVFWMPLHIDNLDSVANLLPALIASDGQGSVPLKSRDITDTSGDAIREWYAERPLSSPYTVHYEVPATVPAAVRGPAPPYELNNNGGGTSAAGMAFLLRPQGTRKYRFDVQWDLSKLPPGSKGVSSFGEGKSSSIEPLNVTDMMNTYFMAGALTTWPERAKPGGFFAATQGKPPFDPVPVMSWTGTMYKHYEAFFNTGQGQSYGVFLRYNAVNSGGGVGLRRAFVTTYGEGFGADPMNVKFTLAHEMFHTFSPYLESPVDGLMDWFGEGEAQLYMHKLPLRYGLVTPDEFLHDLNFFIGRYYTNALVGLPNDQVPEKFWLDTRIRTLPYDGGMLYLAGVDAQLRRKSEGQVSLDTLILKLKKDADAGKVLGQADWEALLREHLGSEAVADFHAYLGGKAPLPPSNAFGPCFSRTTVKLRRYELGFDPAVLTEPGRIVHGVLAGSAASQAGLRDGDEIVRPIPQDFIQGDQKALLHILIRRHGQQQTISYLPRGELVGAYQWERVKGVSDTQCAY